jgi:hypothetical protein
MDLLLNGDSPVAAVLVGAVLGVVLGFLFGFTRRTLGAAILLGMAVNALYPRGSAGLLADVLRPVRSLADDAETRKDSRNATIDSAAGQGGQQ